MEDLEDLEGLIEILTELRGENIVIQNDPSIFNVLSNPFNISYSPVSLV